VFLTCPTSLFVGSWLAGWLAGSLAAAAVVNHRRCSIKIERKFHEIKVLCSHSRGSDQVEVEVEV